MKENMYDYIELDEQGEYEMMPMENMMPIWAPVPTPMPMQQNYFNRMPMYPIQGKVPMHYMGYAPMMQSAPYDYEEMWSEGSQLQNIAGMRHVDIEEKEKEQDDRNEEKNSQEPEMSIKEEIKQRVEEEEVQYTRGIEEVEEAVEKKVEEGLEGRKDFDYEDIEEILEKMETYNPGIFRVMRSYGIPYPISKRLLYRIIRLTLLYYED